MFEKIKEYYEKGVWDERRVCNAVLKGVLTPEQYKAITGDDFPNEYAAK